MVKETIILRILRKMCISAINSIRLHRPAIRAIRKHWYFQPNSAPPDLSRSKYAVRAKSRRDAKNKYASVQKGRKIRINFITRKSRARFEAVAI